MKLFENDARNKSNVFEKKKEKLRKLFGIVFVNTKKEKK